MAPSTESDAAILAPTGDDSNVAAQQRHQQSASATASHHHHKSHPSRDNCDRRRPAEEDHSRLKKMPSALVGKTVSPFLKEHIPGIYAPVGKDFQDESSHATQSSAPREGNTRFCYRHRPDSKCRRTADEKKMGIIQRVCCHNHELGFTFANKCLGSQQSFRRRPRSHHPCLVSLFGRTIQA